MRVPYYESINYKEIRDKRDIRKERIRKDIDHYGEEVLQSEEMQKAFDQKHHVWSTVGEHTIRVAMSSVMLCYALNKLHIKVNVPAVVVGSLCHDLGILGRDDKFSSGKECSREHPNESVKVAKELVDELPDGSEEIIERHMWPMGQSKAPSTIEGMVVSVTDKYTAIKDFVKGSEVKNTSLRNSTREKKDEIKESIQEKFSSIGDSDRSGGKD